MLVNPSSVSFSQAKRITKKYTQSGAVYYHWANRSGRNNDVLNMDFSGSTGNINIRTGTVKKGFYGRFQEQGSSTEGKGPIEWLNRLAEGTRSLESGQPGVLLQGGDYATSGAAKLSSFWNLYSLTREPVLDPKTGTPVYYYISYSSPLMGNSFVTFIGHFSRVMDFTEDATNPYNSNYSFGFTVLSSVPSLDYLYASLVNNLRALYTNPI